MQLHEFVDAVTGDEPPMVRTADDIVTAGRRAQRRRRAKFASAGAAGLVVITVAGVSALPTMGGEPGPAGLADAAASKPADAAPFAFTFQGYDAGTLHVQDPIVVSTAYQMAPVYSDHHTSNDKVMTLAEAEANVVTPERANATAGKPWLSAYLTVYRPGAFDPAGIKDSRPVTVAGRNAVQATLPDPIPQDRFDGGDKLLAWEYADNAWAAVTSYSADKATPSFADLAGLVGGLKPGKPVPAMVPFTVGYVPEGYVPLQSGTHAEAGLDGIITARSGNHGGATYTKPAVPTSGLTAPYDADEKAIKDGFRIAVSPSDNSNQPPEPGKTECQDHREGRSHPGRIVNRSFCNIWSADGKRLLQVSATGLDATLTIAELEKIAKAVTVADVTDESTWTPAADALQP